MLAAVLAWLRPAQSAAPAVVTLEGDASAAVAGVPGFAAAGAPPLRLHATAGEPLSAVLARLNAYRSPAAHLVRVWRAADGAPADLAALVEAGAPLRLVVRSGSLPQPQQQRA